MIFIVMRKFRINEYITLKLERKKTIIFIGGKRFNQCKSLFFLNLLNSESQREIKSVDDIIDNDMDEDLLPAELGITPEEEFWGHCSNLQTWCEYDYDTRLLHSSLSFPLLGRLVQLGDSNAKAVFKEEIAIRIKENPSLFNRLYVMGIFESFTKEEIADILKELEIIDLRKSGLKKFPEFIFNLDNKVLLLDDNEIQFIPNKFTKYNTFRYLSISNNNLKGVPTSLTRINNLESIDLSNNSISHFNLLINDKTFPYLREINLSLNQLQDFPSEFCKLKRLEKLDLSNNKIANIPSSISCLDSLKVLDLSCNNIKTVPSHISNLSNLETLVLSDNKIESSFTLKDLKYLKSLYLDGNILNSLPFDINFLPSLCYLRIDKAQASKFLSHLRTKIESKSIRLFVVE